MIDERTAERRDYTTAIRRAVASGEMTRLKGAKRLSEVTGSSLADSRRWIGSAFGGPCGDAAKGGAK